MLTHGESADQTRQEILLSHSAASTQQWRSWPYHSFKRHPVGWVDIGKKASGRVKGNTGGQQELLVRRTKAVYTFNENVEN